MVSHQWIHKKYIYQLERQIEEQLFSNVPLRVKIIERFYLSRQYTPENFLEVYRPSILLELKNHSVFLNHLFSTAEITFPETNKMHLVLVDSVVAKEREEELVHILEKIFCERCGFDLIVETEMRKPEGESRAMRNSELRIREEVRHVLAHTHYGEMLGEKEQNRMEEQAEAAGEQPKAAAAAKGGEAKKKKQQTAEGEKVFPAADAVPSRKARAVSAGMRTISRANPPIRMCCTEEISRMRAWRF